MERDRRLFTPGMNTFMVAVSPLLGIQMLRPLGESPTHSKLLRDDFANGRTIVPGAGLHGLTLTLVGLTPETARIESRFAVPVRECMASAKPGCHGEDDYPVRMHRLVTLKLLPLKRFQTLRLQPTGKKRQRLNRGR